MSNLQFLSPVERFLLMLLAAPGNQSKGHEPVKGKTWLQKEMFFISQNVGDLNELAGFENYRYGAYSEVIEDVLDQLITDRYVEVETGKIQLSGKGVPFARQLWESATKEEKDIVQEIKALLNDMTNDELLGFSYSAYPDMKQNSDFAKILEKEKFKIALSLLRKGKVSREKAAEIAGQPLARFLAEANKS
ncbi:MAG: hypothetical protein JRN33_06735 [Nitrososphaerota archaeon]|nr:hypothetical protein [Nitrososphaerota archaeon]